jgi:hypothetical protein
MSKAGVQTIPIHIGQRITLYVADWAIQTLGWNENTSPALLRSEALPDPIFPDVGSFDHLQHRVTYPSFDHHQDGYNVVVHLYGKGSRWTNGEVTALDLARHQPRKCFSYIFFVTYRKDGDLEKPVVSFDREPKPVIPGKKLEKEMGIEGIAELGLRVSFFSDKTPGFTDKLVNELMIIPFGKSELCMTISPNGVTSAPHPFVFSMVEAAGHRPLLTNIRTSQTTLFHSNSSILEITLPDGWGKIVMYWDTLD